MWIGSVSVFPHSAQPRAPKADAEEDLCGEDPSGRFAVDLDRATPPTVCTPVTVDRDPTTDDGLCELAFLASAPEPAGVANAPQASIPVSQ